MSTCFVPFCKSGYRSQIKHNKLLNLPNPSLFGTPLDTDTFQKWKKAIPRSDTSLTAKCRVCELHFDPDDIQRHVELKLPDGTVATYSIGKPRLKAGVVPSIFPNVRDALPSKKARESISFGEKPYACDVCEYRASRACLLKKHMRTHTGGETSCRDPLHVESVAYPRVPVTLSDSSSTQYVKPSTSSDQEVTGGDTMPCTSGEKPSEVDIKPDPSGISWEPTPYISDYSEIIIKKEKGEKPYSCDVCGCRTSTASTLKMHMRTHTDEKPYACDVCGLGATRASYLKVHMRTHTGERPYACDVCEYRASRACILKKHMRTHTREKLYACDVCGLGATRASYLKVHMRTHTDEKPYACDVCEYRASRASNLQMHMRTHTREKPHDCDGCEYRTSRASLLKAHMIYHSGGETSRQDPVHVKIEPELIIPDVTFD